MPLTSRLALEASPRSASRARRWVREIYRELDREELIDAATLGTSELVTNAVLHGEAPIVVMVRGTPAHPRVEVHDGSPALPAQPEAPDEDDDPLTTYGRGMAILARCSAAWGASADPTGKVVWFEPSAVESEELVQGLVSAGPQPPVPVRAERTTDVELRGFDLRLMRDVSRNYAELRRELRLLTMSSHHDYPLMSDLSSMLVTYERQVPQHFHDQVARGFAERRDHVDVTLSATAEMAPILTMMQDVFDMADDFCRSERLLSFARSPRERAFGRWVAQEVVAQLGGNPATPWHDMEAASATPDPVA